MALTQITTDGIKDGTITGTDLTTNIDLVDNQKLRLGTGNDLQIYHDGTNSYIDSSTNDLFIRSNGDDLILRSSDDIFLQPAGGGENGITVVGNGAVELYYDNSKKFETVTGGATITGVCTATSFAGDGSSLSGINTDLVSDTSPQLGGNLDVNTKNIVFGDSGGSSDDRLVFGAGSDLQIYHNGNESKIEETGTGGLRINSSRLMINNGDQSETMADFSADGAVELYYDNSKKFETVGNGIKTEANLFLLDSSSGNVGRIKLGTSEDLQIYHDGSHSWIANSTGNLYIRGSDIRFLGTNNDNIIKGVHDGAVELYYDAVKKFETTSAGAKFTGHLRGDDNNRLQLGDSQALQIWNQSTNSYIRNSVASLFIDAQTAGDDVFITNNSQAHYMAKFLGAGAVELYHNNSKKFETTNLGCSITGELSLTSHLKLGDNNVLAIGASEDLKIYHSSTNSILDNQTGHLMSLIPASKGFRVQKQGGQEDILNAYADGAVELYYDGSKKLETISEGIETAEKVRMRHGSTVSNVRQTVYQAISNGTSHTFQINNGHGGGTVTVVGIRNGNSTFATTTIFPFALRSTATAGLGSSIASVGAAQGGFSYQVAGAARGITVTNNDNTTGNFYVTFDVTGAIS